MSPAEVETTTTGLPGAGDPVCGVKAAATAQKTIRRMGMVPTLVTKCTTRSKWAGTCMVGSATGVGQPRYNSDLRQSQRRLRAGRLRMARLESEQRELAEFIRAGSSRGPQCYGSYFDEKGGSCALGAVYEGVYHLPRNHGNLVPDHLERLFRCLDEVVKACPGGCNKRLPLAPMIVHLNDDHRMTREQIAEWLTHESTR